MFPEKIQPNLDRLLAEEFQNPRTDASEKIGRSIIYMMEHLNQPLRVSTLAALAEISSSHFFALFKQHTGHPPIDYFTQMRMRQACRLFDSGRPIVKEVAAALGYNDPFYFSRVFKSVHDISPSQYRNRTLSPDKSAS